MSNYEQKAGHPVLGIILGVLGVLIALLLSVFTGAIGGAVALLLGVGALLLGLFARKKSNRGIGAIIVGAIAIVLAISTTINSVNNFKALHKELEQYADEAPLVVKSFNQPYLGLIGLMLNLPKDEGSAAELVEQFNRVSEKNEKGIPAGTEAPAE